MQDFCLKVYCTYCQQEISGVRIQCCECIDFDICLQIIESGKVVETNDSCELLSPVQHQERADICFCAGAEIGFHRNDHSYKLLNHDTVNIFGAQGSWTGKEQLQLLDAVELYGFGNWTLISNHVDTRFAEECQGEYMSRYLDGNIGKVLWAGVKYKSNLIDHTSDYDISQMLPSSTCTPEEATLVGYRPNRDDYEEEHDIEAEELVSRLQVEIHDPNIFAILNLSIANLYLRRLRERFKRKRLARDYKLITKYCANLRNNIEPPSNNKEPRTLKDFAIPYIQFLPSTELERLLASIEREKELRQRLAELIKFRNLGLFTHEEVIHYQQLRNPIEETSNCSVQEFYYKNGEDKMEINLEYKPILVVEEENQIKANNHSSSSNVNSNLQELKAIIPYGHLLSEHELKFCSSLNLNVLHYTTLKSLIIQDNLLSPGKYSKNDTEPLELSMKEEIIKYLTCSGWLPGATN